MYFVFVILILFKLSIVLFIQCQTILFGVKENACLNDCALYNNEFVTLRVCPTCELSWFKKK